MRKYKDDKLVIKRSLTDYQLDDEEHILNGYAMLINSETIITEQDENGDLYKFREVLEPGCFDECNMKDVVLTLNHDMYNKLILARSKNGKGTLKLNVDEKGLYFTADLDTTNNNEANAIYHSIKRGDLSGMSAIFRVGEDEWNNNLDGIPLRRIKKISILHEISIVNVPAYSDTYVEARSGEEIPHLKEMRENAISEEIKQKERDKVELLKLKYKLIGRI